MWQCCYSATNKVSLRELFFCLVSKQSIFISPLYWATIHSQDSAIGCLILHFIIARQIIFSSIVVIRQTIKFEETRVSLIDINSILLLLIKSTLSLCTPEQLFSCKQFNNTQGSFPKTSPNDKRMHSENYNLFDHHHACAKNTMLAHNKHKENHSHPHSQE